MSSGFITESEAQVRRQRRQEEWEKVRTLDQPLECPAEPFDGRSLFDKLKDQKLKKDLEYEESHKLKNLIRGLDDDEVEFLNLVDQTKMNAEKQHMLEEERELKEFRTRVVNMQEESQDKKIKCGLAKSKPKTNGSNTNLKHSQKSLLMGIGIKRKNIESSCSKEICNSHENGQKKIESLNTITTNQFDRGNLKCIGILPGIGPYNDSSDSEISSGSEDEPDMTCGGFDLIGVKRIKKKTCDGD